MNIRKRLRQLLGLLLVIVLNGSYLSGFTVAAITSAQAVVINGQPYYYYLNNVTLVSEVVEGDLYIGPNSTVTNEGELMVNGNIIVLGQLINRGTLSVAGSINAKSVSDQEAESYLNGHFVSQNVSAFTIIYEPIKVPMACLVQYEGGTEIYCEGVTVPVIQLFVNELNVPIDVFGHFSYYINYYGKDDLTIKIKDVLGNEIFLVHQPVIDNFLGYYVTLDTTGEELRSPKDSLISEPVNPTKIGYQFDGWYKDIELTTPWLFESDKVTENTRLYSKWIPNTYLVTFDSDSGSLIDSQMIEFNKTVALPIAPTKDGYTFAGWYLDIANELIFSFGEPVQSDLNLTAKWDKNDYLVTFMESDIPTLTVEHGSLITEPKNMSKLGYMFSGWYLDKEYMQACDFNTNKVMADTILYPKWIPVDYSKVISLDVKLDDEINVSLLRLPSVLTNGLVETRINDVVVPELSFDLSSPIEQANYAFKPLDSGTYVVSASLIEGDSKSLLATESIDFEVVPKSSDTSLSMINLSVGELAFDPQRFNYEVTLSNEYVEIEVNATSKDSKSLVTIDYDKQLSVGVNRIRILVTAENGDTQEYTVDVTRLAKDDIKPVMSKMANVSKVSTVTPTNRLSQSDSKPIDERSYLSFGSTKYYLIEIKPSKRNLQGMTFTKLTIQNQVVPVWKFPTVENAHQRLLLLEDENNVENYYLYDTESDSIAKVIDLKVVLPEKKNTSETQSINLLTSFGLFGVIIIIVFITSFMFVNQKDDKYKK